MNNYTLTLREYFKSHFVNVFDEHSCLLAAKVEQHVSTSSFSKLISQHYSATGEVRGIYK